MTILTMIIANDSLRRARDVDRDPQNHWNRFRGNFGETERRGGAHMGFSERINTILNSTELTVTTRQKSMKQFRHLDFVFFSFSFLSLKNKQTKNKNKNEQTKIRCTLHISHRGPSLEWGWWWSKSSRDVTFSHKLKHGNGANDWLIPNKTFLVNSEQNLPG